MSIPTVSRVITGSAPVGAERRARVLEAIRRLDFRPNGAARALSQGRQPMVAVFTANTTRYGYAATIEGIEDAARRAGHMVSITVVDTDEADAARDVVNLVLGQPLAGAIVLEYDPPGQAALAAMPSWLPVVAAAPSRSSRGDVLHAFMDDLRAAAHATRYLLSLGHRTVHHVAIPSRGQPSARTIGWQQALHEAQVPEPRSITADWSPSAGYNAGLALLRDTEVTAVLCGNDELAMGLMKALSDNGRRIPQDVSVVGFDDHPLAHLWSPPLTTVRQDFVGLGAQAFRLLMAMLDDEELPTSATMHPELVVRDSAAPPPARRAASEAGLEQSARP